MYKNLHSQGLGGFGDWAYWSSTEAGYQHGGLLEFDKTEHIGMRVTYKLDTLDVRAARRF